MVGGIAMVPLMLALEETQEGSSVTTANDRWKCFMHDDHVRIYSRNGFINTHKAPGFILKQLDSSCFGLDSFIRHGIQERSVLYVVQKPAE